MGLLGRTDGRLEEWPGEPGLVQRQQRGPRFGLAEGKEAGGMASGDALTACQAGWAVDLRLEWAG